MKKTLALILTLLLVLPAYAGAEATVEPAAEQTAARGDGYTIAYDATAFSFLSGRRERWLRPARAYAGRAQPGLHAHLPP